MSSKDIGRSLKRSALVLAMGVCFAGAVQAQSTTGNVFGSVPAGTTVTVRNASGLTRTVSVDSSGRYNISTLPVGRYTVTAERDGQVVGTREVTVLAGAASDVSFGGSGTGGSLDTVTVRGSSVPAIDTRAVDTRSIVTADQLERLPLARSAEAIALLAPGAVSGASGFFGGLVSFGGSGVSENSYYVNGYFTGEPVSNMGGFMLPYGAIEQQETFIGGYGAKYGRSAGGVINQNGRRGTNEWQFGGQVTYTPKSLRGEREDLMFPNIDLAGPNANPALPSTCGAGGTQRCQWEYTDPDVPGTLFYRGKDDTSWGHSYSAYVGGPIVQDRLFFFVAGEMEQNKAVATPNALGNLPGQRERTQKVPKLYGKIDWNITDNHLVELTYLGEKTDRNGVFNAYDFDTGAVGARMSTVDEFERTNRYAIAKYTGWLTDNLTFSATYGRSKMENYLSSVIPGMPWISSPTLQNPALNGGTPIRNAQAAHGITDSVNETEGLRADLEWALGDHTLTVGIDNIEFTSKNEGVDMIAPRWIYGRTVNNIAPTLGVGSAVTAANPNGYYVNNRVFETATAMSLQQKAWYIEDRWQVTDNFLLSLGLRNDQFTNKNDAGESYLDAKDQWAPRLGFAWDVFGNSSMKVFGNAGRYFLAMPNNVAIRGASASTFTNEYFTYTGIGADGSPTGLTPVPRLDGGTPRPVSSNGEYGTAVDVRSFAPSDLKNMYQDEYILGFENMITERLMLGAKLTFRDLKSAVDDICDPYTFADANGLELVDPFGNGYLARNASGQYMALPYCYMFNPGGTNTFSVGNTDAAGNPTGTRSEFTMSQADWRFPDKMKRKYTALDIYLERPFDGRWEARLDYTFSRSRGNMEGQVKSEFGQTNISKTQDWDAAEMMTYAYGFLANDRRHQLKARGSLQLTEELLVGANVRIVSGGPISCLGYFNPDGSIDEGSPAADPIAYGASYHTCFGSIASPGSRRTPWAKWLDLGLTYRPNFADKKLALGLQVRNVLNDQQTLQVDVTSEDDPYTVSNTYMLPIGRQEPRTVVFTASYDW